jgi:saccharopine dehydrogenase-like NADP-dependent oxidoreductase
MENILVVGLGKVGTLVATLLSQKFNVTGIDVNSPAYNYKMPFEVQKVDISNQNDLEKVLENKAAVVSALPYYLNLALATRCIEKKIHYFDLTEDVPTTQKLRDLAVNSQSVVAPQCGLAPGLIGIVGADLAKKFTKIRDIELRVGALPRYPNGLLGYSFTWSPAGVINEYLNDAEVIQNGERKWVSSLDGTEVINIEGQEFEAFSTSGGLGTMCETFENKVDTLNYKTIRYPGHAKLMRFLLYELVMKNDKKALEKILTEAKPAVQEDVVYVYAVVEGWKGELMEREEYYHAFYPKDIAGQKWRAISWTTAASVAAVVDMVFSKKLSQTGFIKQEEIDFESFLGSYFGNYFKI